jgi:predicted acyltransferase
MFMVGVALPYSYSSRKARGDSDGWIFAHTLWRAALLVALGVFLSSNGSAITRYTFVNVLSQIGLGYVFVYLLRGRGLLVQLAALAVILVGYTALFAAYPLPPADKDWQAVGVKDAGEKLSGFQSHWAKNANTAHTFDVWFLNLFPQPEPPPGVKPEEWAKRGFVRGEDGAMRFAFNEGGYQTLNFVPSMATMLLGLMAGEMLRGRRSRGGKLGLLVVAGVVCLGLGFAAGEMGFPIVKRIWTPSWALFSAGWTFLMLAAFYGVIDVAGWKRWAFPLVVVGMNSIAIYCMSQLMRGWIGSTMKTHLPSSWFAGPYGLILYTTLILVVLWLICLWMYRRKIFLKI